MKRLNHLFSIMLNCPREILIVIDNKIGIEIFKLGVVFSTVYFVQGMGGLSNIPLLFYFKDVLKFSEDQMQNFGAITMLAWLIKPLFGYISDRFPICGYRRKSYMILMAIIAAISWWLLAWMVSNNYNQYLYLVLVFNFSSLGYAFVDVVCDGLMVEKGQSLKKEDIFVNIQWFALGIAGVAAGVFSGELQYAVKAKTIPLSLVFIIVGCIPLLTSAIAWFFVKEGKIAKSTRREKNIPRQQAGFSLIKEVAYSKIFWLLSAFIFFWKFSPSFGAVFQYYSIDILKFDEIFLGKITAIGNAIFPLSILLYAGMLKWLPFIKTKHYLYGSIAISLIYSAISLLFYVPENTFNWLRFALPFYRIDMWIGFGFVVLGFYFCCWLMNRYNTVRKIKFCFTWMIIVMPLSLFFAFWFAGISFSPFTLSYRSLTIAESVIFGYTSIASFLIPLALAAKLAPKKAEGMTYAYFMALSNVAGNFLPSIAGAQMFRILKKAILQPETIIQTIPLKQLATIPTYIVQQSYLALQPIIGNADFLGENAYRALILRYATFIGAGFILISILFVYLLPLKKGSD